MKRTAIKRKQQHPLISRLRGQIVALEQAAKDFEISGTYSGERLDDGRDRCDVVREYYYQQHDRVFATLRDLNAALMELH